jgi:hypothetical protein
MNADYTIIKNLIPEFCKSPPEADKPEAFMCKALKVEAIRLRRMPRPLYLIPVSH